MRESTMDQLIEEHLSELNESDQIIWKYISKNKKECSELSIQELARNCHVSHTTAFRFAKKLGFSGYSEMRSFLKWEINQDNYHSQKAIFEVSRSLIKCVERYQAKDMTDLFELLNCADQVYAHGSGEIQRNAVRELKEKMLYQNLYVNLLEGKSELYHNAECARPGDVYFFYSLSGLNETQITAAKKLKEKGCIIVLVAGQGSGGMNDYADIVLDFYAKEVPSSFEFKCYMTSYFGVINEFVPIKYWFFQKEKEARMRDLEYDKGVVKTDE